MEPIQKIEVHMNGNHVICIENESNNYGDFFEFINTKGKETFEINEFTIFKNGISFVKYIYQKEKSNV